MIRINLLPAELRAPERTSFGTMLLVIGGTVLVALSVIMLVAMHLIWLPAAIELKDDRATRRVQKEKAAKEAKAAEAERLAEKYVAKVNEWQR